VYSLFDLAEKPEDAVRLTVPDQIERGGLQNLIWPDQPDHTPLTEDLLHPLHDSGDLRLRSFERLEPLDLFLKTGNLLVNGVVEAGLKVWIRFNGQHVVFSTKELSGARTGLLELPTTRRENARRTIGKVSSGSPQDYRKDLP
jgi:hypothetical protein